MPLNVGIGSDSDGTITQSTNTKCIDAHSDWKCLQFFSFFPTRKSRREYKIIILHLAQLGMHKTFRCRFIPNLRCKLRRAKMAREREREKENTGRSWSCCDFAFNFNAEKYRRKRHKRKAHSNFVNKIMWSVNKSESLWMALIYYCIPLCFRYTFKAREWVKRRRKWELENRRAVCAYFEM